MEKDLRRMERLFEKAVGQRKSASSLNGGAEKYLISPSFQKKFDNWNKVSTGRQIKVGTTSTALQSIGVDSKEIYWDTSKIKKIMFEHPDMTENVIKQVPNILEEPILIMESKTVAAIVERSPETVVRVPRYGEIFALSD